MNDEKTDENLPNDGAPEPKKKKPKCCKCKKKSFLTQCSKCNQLICISHFAPNLHECDKMAKKEEDLKDANRLVRSRKGGKSNSNRKKSSNRGKKRY